MSEQAVSSAKHETSDMSVAVVAGFALGLIGSAVIIYLSVIVLFRWFERTHPSPFGPSRIVEPHMIAPEPRLQTEVASDLNRFFAAQNARLNGYGWVDRPAGILHIPIARAMDLVAERGLPTRGPGTQNSSGKTPEDLQREKAAATSTQP